MSVVDFSALTTSVKIPLPCGAYPLIGVDGQHYALADCTYAGHPCVLACAETGAYTFDKTPAQWNTDLATNVPGVSGTYTLANSPFIPIVGTAYFWIIGYSLLLTPVESVAIRYKINSPASVTVDGWLRLASTTTGVPITRGMTGGNVYGVNVIGGAAYVVMTTGTALFPTTSAAHLLKLPLTGNLVDATPGSIDSQITLLTYEWWFFERQSDLAYLPSAALLPDSTPGNIGVLCYVPKYSAANPGLSTTLATLGSVSAMLYAVVNPVARTCGAITNVSSSFGVPWTDSATLYSGGAGTNQDDYTSPAVFSNSLYFARGFSDSQTKARVRPFTMNGASAISTNGATYEFTASSVAVTSGVQAIFIYPTGSKTVASMLVDNKRFIFLDFPGAQVRAGNHVYSQLVG